MSSLIDEAVPRIAHGVRLQFEKAQDAWVLLYPEGMVTLGESAGDVLQACDGDRTLGEVIAHLQVLYQADESLADDVREFLQSMVDNNWVSL